MEKGDGAVVMAGGTDIMLKKRRGLLKAKALIDLQKIMGMNRISFEDGKGLTIGAMARLADVECHPIIRKTYPAIADAARATANVQIRNLGTVAGNLCNAAPSAETALCMSLGGHLPAAGITATLLTTVTRTPPARLAASTSVTVKCHILTSKTHQF